MVSNPPAARPLSLSHDVDYRSIADARFVQEVLDRRLEVVKGDAWSTRSELTDAPGETILDLSYYHSATNERLIELDGAIAQLMLHERSLVVRMAAIDAAHAASGLKLLREGLPEAADTEIEVAVRFWWWQSPVAQQMTRMIPALSWDEISNNYAKATLGPIGELTDWEEGPPAGGRLLLWHGPSGTGKTTALRSLAWSWRSWAELQFITDPEEFLGNPSYLMRITSGHHHSRDGTPSGRWRVLVLEDAGEFLATDARQIAGQGLSRLLNVCDGVLGQATKTLILVTTNEPLKSIHPALSRAGRCLSQIEFKPLDEAEIEAWCDVQGIDPPEGSRASLADLYAHLNGSFTNKTRDEGFGFGGVVAA